MNIEINFINVLIITITIFVILYIYQYFMDNIIYYYNGNINIDNLKISKDNDTIIQNKKIAICFSGQIRDGYEECLTLILIFLIKKYNADVFCCFEECDNDIKQYINNTLNPKKVKYVENYIKSDKNIVSMGTLSMYNKIYLSNQLKKDYENENNFTYDYVIRIRPDLIIKESLPKYIFTENKNKIYFPYISKIFSYYGYPDFLAIGNSKLMDIYSDIFIYLLDNTNKCNISETLLYKYLNMNDVNCEIINYPIQLYRFKYDNLKNIVESIIYIYSLKNRYIFENNC